MALSAGAALPLIAQYESGNQNVLNTQGSSASGYYQIINGTWQQFAPTVGVNLNQYPTAMTAPQDVQTQVATAIYNQQGIGPWSSNVPLLAAINGAGGAPVSTTTTDTAPIGVGGGNSGAAVDQGGGLGGLGTSIIAGVWEIVSRGALILVGALLIVLALAALIIESKTVQTAARHVKAVASVG